MSEASLFETVITILGLSLWVLFPAGLFLSVAHVDKNTSQVISLQNLRHNAPLTRAQQRAVRRAQRPPLTLGQVLLYLKWRLSNRFRHHH